jgi:hypothetical protein
VEFVQAKFNNAAALLFTLRSHSLAGVRQLPPGQVRVGVVLEVVAKKIATHKGFEVIERLTAGWSRLVSFSMCTCASIKPGITVLDSKSTNLLPVCRIA